MFDVRTALPRTRSALSPACGGEVERGQACTNLCVSPLPNPPPQAGEGTPWQIYLQVHGGAAPKPGRSRKAGAAHHSRLIKEKLRAQQRRAR